MAVVSLEIDGNRVDLFKDESIELTRQIKELTDISRVKTDYSRTFSLPDSPRNRSIFKNYQVAEVTNGFDGRRLVNAVIRLNGFEFTRGELSLDGVSLSNGNIKNYKVTFFGKVLSLKSIFKNDKLNSLVGLDTLNFNYTDSYVINKLKENPNGQTPSDLIFSLISAEDRIIYDSDVLNASDKGNIAGDGVSYTNFKPSIRKLRILNEINVTYDLGIDNFDFVDDDLFMWLSNSNKTIKENNELFNSSIVVSNFLDSEVQGDRLFFAKTGNVSSIIEIDSSVAVQSFTIDFTLDGNVQNSDYKVDIVFNNNIIFSDTYTGDSQITEQDLPLIFNESGNLIIEVSAGEANFLNVSVFATDGIKDDFIDSNESFSVTEETVSVSKIVPDIKVIDFMSGIFKMYNLIAFFDEKDNLKLQTLDSFYQENDVKEYDVTKYTDIDSVEIQPVSVYEKIELGYNGLNTFLAFNHEELFYSKWGTENYLSSKGFKNDTYSVALPFEHMKFERLKDENNGNFTPLMYGYATDKEQRKIKTKPLIYFNQFENTTGSSVNIIKENGTKELIITAINMPSNIKSRTGSNDNIHFKREIDEFNFNVLSGGTLFDRFYVNTIAPIYDIRSRMVKIQCNLPLNNLLRLKLNDVIVFRNRKYRINKYDINLQNLKARFELTNIL